MNKVTTRLGKDAVPAESRPQIALDRQLLLKLQPDYRIRGSRNKKGPPPLGTLVLSTFESQKNGGWGGNRSPNTGIFKSLDPETRRL